MIAINNKGSISAIKTLLIISIISSIIYVVGLSIKNVDKLVLRNVIINDNIEKRNIYQTVQYLTEKKVIDDVEKTIEIIKDSDLNYVDELTKIIGKKEDYNNSRRYYIEDIEIKKIFNNDVYEIEFKPSEEKDINESPYYNDLMRVHSLNLYKIKNGKKILTGEVDIIIEFPDLSFSNNLNKDIVKIKRKWR